MFLKIKNLMCALTVPLLNMEFNISERKEEYKEYRSACIYIFLV